MRRLSLPPGGLESPVAGVPPEVGGVGGAVAVHEPATGVAGRGLPGQVANAAAITFRFFFDTFL